MVRTPILSKRLLIVATLAALLGAPVASSAQGAAGKELTLSIANNVEVPTFDPQKVVGIDAIVAIGNLYDRLVYLDVDGSIKPWLALSWSVASDQRTWTFHLRHDAKFHDGSPVTADAIKFSIDRAIGPGRPSSMARTYLSPIGKVTVVDPYTVMIVTTKPFAPLLKHLGHLANGAIVNPAVVKAHGDDLSTAVDAGSGMYKLVSWRRNNELVLARNDDWWGPKPKYERLIYKPVSQVSTRIIMLEKGEVDVVTTVPGFEAMRLRRNPNIKVTSTHSYRTMYFAYNMNHPAFQNLKLRQALNYSVDVDGIIKALQSGYGSRAHSLITANLPFYSPAYNFNYDPKKAKALLAESGVSTQTPLVVVAPKGRWAGDSEVAQAVADNLRAIGLKVDLRIIGDWGQYQQVTRGGHFDLAMYAWAPGSLDPDATFSSILLSTGASNLGRYNNPQTDRLIRAAAETVDPAERAKRYKDLQELVGREVPYLLLYDIVSFSASRKGVCGIKVRGDEAVIINDAKPC